MSNPYFTASGTPATNAQGASSPVRAEFTAIQSAFDLLPTLSGNALKLVGVNAGESALVAVATTGTGTVVLNDSPTLTTPTIGVAAGTSLKLSTLTAGRMVLSTTDGLLTDTANITASAGVITASGFIGPHNGTLGATTPAAASVTTLDASGTVNLANGSANYVKATGADLGNPPAFEATGGDTNIDFVLRTKGTGTIYIGNLSAGNILAVQSAGLAVSGSVSTTDPAGGAGPVWKFGIAASVSPTAPNRTIRVSIGGTSYYIAAKTTND